MEAITSQISALYEQANEEGRHKIQNTLRDLQHSLDTDFELSLRIGSGVCTFPYPLPNQHLTYHPQPLQMSLITIGVDLQLFTHLASSPSPITLYDLVKKTSAAPKILSHLLRAMASFGLISETAANTYTSTRTTRLLANDNVAGALTHIWQLHVPTINAFPSYLQDRKYQDLTSNTDLPFQVAMKTDLAPFDWMKQHPEHLKSLAHAGAIQREGSWFENYALLNSETKAIKADDEAVLLVDIGGAFGHQALAFKKHFLDLQKRIAVQDMQESISQAPKDDGVEKYVHDFFTEQRKLYIPGLKYSRDFGLTCGF
jgi:demethylsterigmatocystin 6-O-methyltransferase